MTPDERESLQGTGNTIIGYLPDLAIFISLLGVSLGLWVLAVLSLTREGLKNSWPRKGQFAALMLTAPIGIGTAILPIFAMSAAIRGALIDFTSEIVSDVRTAPYEIVRVWSEQTGLLLNDAVVIWRVCVLYPERKMLLFSLCFIFCATTATGFAATGLSSSISVALANIVDTSSSDEASRKAALANKFNNASNALSLATNLFATTLILLVLWKHRRFINHMGFQRGFTSSQRVLLFLVESGLIFCISQVYDFIMNTYVSNNINTITLTTFDVLSATDDIFWASLPMFLPTVILVVANNKNIAESLGFGPTFQGELDDLEASTENG